VHDLLTRLELDVPKGHLDQAIDAHLRKRLSGRLR
jgi:hypothetical protein